MYEIKNKELEKKIKLAEENGSYLITITFKEKEIKENGILKPKGALQHFWSSFNFPRDAIIHTIDHLKLDLQKECCNEPLQNYKWN